MPTCTDCAPARLKSMLKHMYDYLYREKNGKSLPPWFQRLRTKQREAGFQAGAAAASSSAGSARGTSSAPGGARVTSFSRSQAKQHAVQPVDREFSATLCTRDLNAEPSYCRKPAEFEDCHPDATRGTNRLSTATKPVDRKRFDKSWWCRNLSIYYHASYK